MKTINMTIGERVEKLRRWMRERDFEAFIIPTLDPHNSEYLPDYWKTREWLTGFTGSAGLAIVTMKEAALWTDSRYFLQAEEQLKGTPFELMRQGEEGVPSPECWLSTKCMDGLVGYYGEVMSLELYEQFEEEIDEDLLCDTEDDPFDEIWQDRPALPSQKVFEHPVELAGLGVTEKTVILQTLHLGFDCEISGWFFNDLSEIAWFLNVRGGDIEYNPFVISYLYVDESQVVWFVDKHKLTTSVKEHLKECGVKVKDYGDWRNFIEKINKSDKLAAIGVPPGMNCQVLNCLDDYIVMPSPLQVMRSTKNNGEIEGFRKAMKADGVAMVRFLRWLDEHVGEGNVTEIDVDRQLTGFRAEHEDFHSLSFATIAAYGPNAAIVHYEAEEGKAATLQPKGLLLLDSGAHYRYGTTDITRTIALGETTAEERKAYTLVLKGHIALSRMQFPHGATGLQLDTAARYAMWQSGYDFGHGTGHGVGAFLSVHEGPLQIRKDVRPATITPYDEGMVTSNEPGIYVPGKFGVRIENMLLVKRGMKNAFATFLNFETLTLCPYDLRPVEREMLCQEEVDWLNSYHDMVRNSLTPLLQDEADRRWLEDATKPIA